MPENKNVALKAVRDFKKFRMIYEYARRPQNHLDSIYGRDNLEFHFTNKPIVVNKSHTLFGKTEPSVNITIDSNLIENAEKFNNAKISPIMLHAFRGHVASVKRLLKWGASMSEAVEGFKLAGHFDNEEKTKAFLGSINDLVFRAKIAVAANCEKELPKFKLR